MKNNELPQVSVHFINKKISLEKILNWGSVCMKILALDLGDVWIGSAISDALKITCKPLTTVKVGELDSYLRDLLQKEYISVVVVGYPKTVGDGGHSDQTKKIIAEKERLEAEFKECKGAVLAWILWDERFSSKRAAGVQKGIPSKEDKMKSHSIAASFILQSYLDHLAFNRPEEID